MQIHVVSPGESLWEISQLYGVNISTLVQSNEIPNPDRLVPGQTIVVPITGQYHWVQPGQTLFSISRSYNIPLNELMRVNRISNPNAIQPGLRLYIPPQPRPTVDVGAYLDPDITGDRTIQVVDSTGPYLTYLTIFDYDVNPDGSLTPVQGDGAIIEAARRQRVMPLMVLTNVEEGSFSQELATQILGDESLQQKVLDEALDVIQEKNYAGLDVDFEYLGAENREPYNAFMQRAAALLKPRGYTLSSALAPKTRGDQPGVLYEGHDYSAHGQINDFIFFMTYEWGWSGGPPMAVSPIDQVRQVMEYAVSVVPRDKIMMGIPLYGYDWTLPYVPGGAWARVLSPQQAIELAAQYGVSIQYDPTSQAPFFRYTDQQGRQHEVWFEDARSIQAKFNLVKELGIRGFYYWVLGRDFPQNWLLILDNFTVRKRI